MASTGIAYGLCTGIATAVVRSVVASFSSRQRDPGVYLSRPCLVAWLFGGTAAAALAALASRGHPHGVAMVGAWEIAHVFAVACGTSLAWKRKESALDDLVLCMGLCTAEMLNLVLFAGTVGLVSTLM